MTEQNRFSKKFAEKSTSELENIVGNNDYQRDAQLAAAWELKHRGEISEDDIPGEPEPVKTEKVQIQAKEASNVTDDPSAPLLYHSKFILVYGALFSVFFGGILLAMNLRTLNKTKLAWGVLIASFIYSGVQITVLNLLDQNSTLTVLISMLGVYLIEKIFWVNQVEKNLKFRKRSVWTPLIIAILIYAPLLYFIIAYGV
ncbi:MAG: hypothetical protein KI790_10975 [Cyclobacteriaceae bacterium]|nr:hypothetical protein [Cyclobacteriaceae bacterium HetDA_MAG_MS6]